MADTPEPVTPPQSVDPNKPAPIQKKDEPQLKTQEAKQPAPNVVTQQPQAQQQTSNTSDVGTTMSLSAYLKKTVFPDLILGLTQLALKTNKPANFNASLWLGEFLIRRATRKPTDFSQTLAQIERIRKSHPGNLACKHFNLAYFNKLSHTDKQELLKIIKSGTDNADSSMGCYAMRPSDYDKYRPFFRKVLAEYHRVSEDAVHRTDWDLKNVKDVPANGVLDLKEIGCPPLSLRIRVGRNLEAFPLPGGLSKSQQVQLEKQMHIVFEKLIAMKRFGGNIYSLTPGDKYHIGKAKYKELVRAHIMFKDMSADKYLHSAGISNGWPYGRGCYVSADRGFIIWVGEEDHLRVVCMGHTTNLMSVFSRLKQALDVCESLPGMKFAKSKFYGYVTSCPTNLGTGMRASVHIKLPHLTSDGTPKKVKVVAKRFGLSVRGVGGEHTPIGADGTVDISPSARFCITEANIVCSLYKGLKLLLEEEHKFGKAKEK